MCGVYRSILGGNITDVNKTPVRIGHDEFKYRVIKKMVSGSNHSFVLTDEKRVYAWGDPEVGALGRRPSVRRKYKMGMLLIQLPFRNVGDVFSGDNNGFVTKTNSKGAQETYSWGLNNYGQLG